MFIKILFLVGLASAGLLLMLLSTTEPSSVGAIGILAVFLLGYLTILCFLTLTLWGLIIFCRKTGKNIRFVKKIVAGVTLKDVYYYSSVLALAPVIIISLRSVGEVGPYEIGLVVLFEVLGCIYVAKRAS